jgi:hypothetical protein
MVQSIELFEDIKKALPPEDWKTIEAVIAGIQHQQGRRARKNIVLEINNVVIETALKANNPELLLALREIQSNESDDLFSRIIRQYIVTQDDRWQKSVFSLSEKIGKKSNQSRIFAMLARDLIDAGVSRAIPLFIDEGILMLERISFRKYRSDIMIDIIPLLIVWAITTRNQKYLRTSLVLIEEISDISKRAVLHAELSKAMATIAILEKDRSLFFDSINHATAIHQKIRRQDCISIIIEKGARSIFGKEMVDIPQFLANFKGISPEACPEIISSLTEQLLERVKDKTQIITILEQLCRDTPEVTGTIVIDLLKKAERSGDPWFLSTAMDLQQHISDAEVYPLRELVRAGISVARNSSDMQVLMDLIPVIERHCNPAGLSRIYLQYAQIMLDSGDFTSALGVFGKIDEETKTLPPYTECLIQLLKAGTLNDRIPLIYNNILLKLNRDVADSAIYRTVVEVSKEYTFQDIIVHILSLRNLILLHPKQDHLILECITILVDRGFLDFHDPGILIRFAESIREQPLKERAISNIIVRIAKIGVRTNNRDFLQRAIGLTIEIDGQNTRSNALSSIIDEASTLAAQQGDLDMLLRMKSWSNSLLEAELAAYAMANIVDGIIKYAIDRQSFDALEEAYRIAEEIDDPSLKAQLFERISECFVRIGCMILKDAQYPLSAEESARVFEPFQRSLDIVKQHIKPTQVSLKIAGLIDIILSFSRTSSTNPDFIIPLAIFAIEIENSYERDAMMSRIISNIGEDSSHPNSTDPYETMAFLLMRDSASNTNPVVITIADRMLQMIDDPYTRLSGLCDLADLLVRRRELDHAQRILDTIEKTLVVFTTVYQKIQILSYLATTYSLIDGKKSVMFLNQGIGLLDGVEREKEAITRRQIVYAIVRQNAITPDPQWYTMAVQVVQKITDPVEYINSLLAIYNMVRPDKVRSNDLLQYMENAVDRISSPYEKASALLNIVPLALESTESELPLKLLKKTEQQTKKINISSIADTVRINIADAYLLIYQKYHNEKVLASALQVIRSIEDDEIRYYRLEQMQSPEVDQIPPQFLKIKSFAEKMIEEGVHPNHVASLERLVKTAADRGREAIFFCYLSIYFKNKGQEKLSRRMIQNSIKEARILRPLSRRSFIMCDIALKIFTAGCEHTAQDLLDLAIDAATNIRQSSLRDEVFDELGLAIKIMQGMNG